MKLTTYIDTHFNGNKNEFARFAKVQHTQVHRWIRQGAVVIGNCLYVNPRQLPEVPEAPADREAFELFIATSEFEAFMKENGRNIERDPNTGEYLSPAVRTAWVGYTFALHCISSRKPTLNPEVTKALQCIIRLHPELLDAGSNDSDTPYQF